MRNWSVSGSCCRRDQSSSCNVFIFAAWCIAFRFISSHIFSYWFQRERRPLQCFRSLQDAIRGNILTGVGVQCFYCRSIHTTQYSTLLYCTQYCTVLYFIQSCLFAVIWHGCPPSCCTLQCCCVQAISDECSSSALCLVNGETSRNEEARVS